MSRQAQKIKSFGQMLCQAACWRVALPLFLCQSLHDAVSAQTPEIQRITISGTERRLQLETKVEERLDRGHVARDVKRLWKTGWFDDIRVLADSSPQGATIKFVLKERPRYLLRKLRFEPRHFELPAPILPGTFVDRASVERSVKIFQESLRDSGYHDATVDFELIPAGIREADLVVRVAEGKRTVVGAVTVTGANPADSHQVARTLRAVQPRTLFPGFPRVWNGWKLRPTLTRADVDFSLRRLRSYYIARGYLDATAVVESLAFADNRASIAFRVDPGRPYRLDRFEIPGHLAHPLPNRRASELPLKELCQCLLEKRTQADRSGVIDFGARLLVQRNDNEGEVSARQGVSISVRVETGPAYRVRRIEFQGNRQLSESTMRKMLLLSEGDPFDRDRLRRSLARLNQTGLIHPIGDVQEQRDSSQLAVDVTISVREKDKGSWFLGGPAWVGLARNFRFSIGSRLPNWGSSRLELPTYVATLNLASPLAGLPVWVLAPARLSTGLSRPYLPGQGWRSGFQLSPQDSWRHSLFASSLLQLKPRLGERLQERPALPVPLDWNTPSPNATRMPTAGILVCDPAHKPSTRLLTCLHNVAEWLFAIGL